jgi:ankyrin repeat protein
VFFGFWEKVWNFHEQVNGNLVLVAKSGDSRTALHLAAQHGHEALAQGLLGAGADINAKDASKWTPLHFAADWNKPEVGKVLLAHGAQVNARDRRGFTALNYARGKREVEALLRQHGAE